jgi:hypothetical protein
MISAGCASAGHTRPIGAAPAQRCYGSAVDLGPVEEKVIVRCQARFSEHSLTAPTSDRLYDLTQPELHITPSYVLRQNILLFNPAVKH